MRSHPKRREGFTLMELMITVAIIGILAAIAIPAFSRYQNRSRRAEAMTNVAAIATAENSYFAAAGVYLGANAMPGPPLGAFKRGWSAAARAEYDPIGYQPEGGVYYDYEVNTLDCGCPDGANGEAVCFTVLAVGDLDGDGTVGGVAYFKRDPTGNHCPTGVLALPGPPPDHTGEVRFETPFVLEVMAPLIDDF